VRAASDEHEPVVPLPVRYTDARQLKNFRMIANVASDEYVDWLKRGVAKIVTAEPVTTAGVQSAHTI
jgi:hypothetical protein